MRIVFMGTPSFVVRVLEGLSSKHEVCAVYTAPDSVSRRGRKALPSPVAIRACELGIEVRKPARLNDPAEIDSFKGLSADLLVSASYGLLVPKAIFAAPAFGCLNIHPSLLPRWRGAAPVQRAVLAGDAKTGVCIMRMSEGFDTGDVARTKVVEAAGKSATELTDELFEMGSEMLLDVIDGLEKGTVEWSRQSEEGATYAQKIEKSELRLDPAASAADNVRRIMASTSSAPARMRLFDKDCTVTRAECAPGLMGEGSAAISGDVLTLGCNDPDMHISVKVIKPDGSREMSVADWSRGLRGSFAGSWGRV